MSSLRPAPGDLLIVRCVISEKVCERGLPSSLVCVCDENLLVWNFHGCKVRWMHSNINSRVVVDGITLS